MMRLVRGFLLFTLLVPTFVPVLQAQAPAGTGLTGNVLDPDSKAVVTAAVVIRNEATGDIARRRPTAAAHSAAPDLAPGTLRDRSARAGLRSRPPQRRPGDRRRADHASRFS